MINTTDATGLNTSDAILFSCFTALRLYVEEDKALAYCNLHPGHVHDGPKWYHDLLGRYFKQFRWSRPDLGLLRLREEAGFTLEDGSMSNTAKNAIEINELYDWWMNKRTRRPNPYDAVMVGIDRNVIMTTASDQAEETYTHYMAEDAVMLRRLMDIRPHLI